MLIINCCHIAIYLKVDHTLILSYYTIDHKLLHILLNTDHMLITLRLVRLPIGTNAYTPGLVSFGDSNILMAHLERLDMATT